MGRLEALKGRQEMWGYQDSRRLASLRLDKEYRDSLEPPLVVPLDWVGMQAEVASLRREVRLLYSFKKGATVPETKGFTP